MSRRVLLVIAGCVVGVAVLAFGGLYAYISLSNRDAPPPVSLTPQTPLAAATTGTGASSSGGASGTASGSASGPASGTSCDTPAVDGAWTVSSGGSTFVGYRVNEKLAALPARSDAVGRTGAVTGTVTISGATVSAAEVTADLTKLTSNESRRDNFIRQNGLESDQYPTATFKLSSSLSFGSVPAAVGQAVSATAHGQLTVHGQTRTVDIPLQAQRTCAGLEVVGSLPIVFSDYGMTPPSIGGFVSVDDHGTMELKLELVRSR